MFYRPEHHCMHCGRYHSSFYHEYVIERSEGWQRKCQLAYQYHGYMCQACWVRPATQVHHLTYARLGYEKLSDLRVLCDECHRHMHRKMAEPGGWGLEQRRLAI